MDNNLYYEQFSWEGIDHKLFASKIAKIIATIPDDVKTIIDVGCGNGAITNELAKEFCVTGIDRSKNALHYVKTDKILCSSDAVPLPDKNFDMVFSSELLEHLEVDKLQKTSLEMQRLTKKYIFITVPNQELLEKTFIECEKCNYRYNRSYHLQSFTKEKLIALFPDFELIDSFLYGKKIRTYKSEISAIKHASAPAVSWIPYYWTSREKRHTMCPNCEFSFVYKYKFHPLSLLCDLLNVLVSPKKPYWLFVLLKRLK
jgi:ubiquinone/menaquinone biosynthesis C-methylase UbiE